MTRILFLFLDGVGLGQDDPQSNPLAAASLPTLRALLGGEKLLAGVPRLESERATFIPTDARLGVDGLPQSATGQASIVTGLNVPREAGGHWGPKPNRAVAEVIRRATVFRDLVQAGKSATLLNAFPQRYFDHIASGRRNYSAIPLAVTAAGLPLRTADDLRRRQAFSADFTGEGWRQHLGYHDTPVYLPFEAGERIARVAAEHDFSFFEHWPTDYAGHRGTRDEAIALLERLDSVMAGALSAWDDSAGLIVLTSDHGNLEDLAHRHHTPNRVPSLVVGAPELRQAFTHGLTDLTGFAPAIKRLLLS